MDDDDGPRGRLRTPELRVAGVAACHATLNARPDDVLRMFVTENRADEFRDALAWMARSRRPFRVVPREELDRISATTHHEGVCVVTHPIPEQSIAWLADAPSPTLCVAAPGLENPHNLGAMLRVAAHFGARAIVLEEGDPRLSAAACRVAEGGAEHVAIVRVDEMGYALDVLREGGFTVYATSSHGPGRVSLFDAPMPPRLAWLVGSESRGLPRGALETADEVVAIDGTDRVESLNVATATAVLLAEWTRPRR